MKNFTTYGVIESPFLKMFSQGLVDVFHQKGYQYMEDPTVDNIKVVFNFITADRPRPFRRKAQATFVVSILETENEESLNNVSVLKLAYPYLVRSLSNHFVYISHNSEETQLFFITPEQGCYNINTYRTNITEDFLEHVYKRLEPLASSQLVIDNDFETDLPEELHQGDDYTFMLRESGKKLDKLNLLPAPFPLEDYVSERDMRQLKKLYGLGGLSYGNLSTRKDEERFWMSASGVNKADMKVIGQDMLLIKGFDQEKNSMKISVPPNISVKRASVDAIEHWMIYTEHPEVGAIVHVHAWMDGIAATEINYPCGTIELAENVAELVRQAENPAQAVIGLKNHGLTITGKSLEDIFERIEGKIIPQVPMM